MSFTFNGIKKDWLKVRRELVRSTMVPIERGLIPVPERPGAVFEGTKIYVRVLVVPVDIMATSLDDLNTKEEELTSYLFTDEPEELIFDYAPTRKYYALLDGSIETELVGEKGRTDIVFICPDPYKYSYETKTTAFANDIATVVNSGGIDIPPLVVARVLSDIAYADLYTDEGYIRIGIPADFSEPVVEREERLFWSQANNLTGWTSAGTNVDGGVVSGAFKTNGTEFLVTDFGATHTTWHGPSVKQSIPDGPVVNFIADFRIKFPSPKDTFGRIEHLLLDSQSNVVAKIAMKRTGGARGNVVEVRLGGGSNFEFIMNYGGSKGFEWNNFDGILRLERIDNVWIPYVAQIDPVTGRHTSRVNADFARFVDEEAKYAAPISQVQIHIGKNGPRDVPGMAIKDMKVYRVNEVPSEDPRVIARLNDVITFDVKNDVVLINGEPREDLVEMAPPFPYLKKGVTSLILEPSGAFDATAVIEEGYL